MVVKRSGWISAGVVACVMVGGARDARAVEVAEWEIRSGGALVGMGDAENRTNNTAAVWCTGTAWQQTAKSRPYFFTRSGDYSKDVAIYQEKRASNGDPKVELYATLKANGRLELPSGQRRAIIQQEVGGGGTTYKTTFRDEFGALQGYVYWSPVPGSSGFYDARDKKIGTFGSKIDRDMRMLALFYFLVYPGYCS